MVTSALFSVGLGGRTLEASLLPVERHEHLLEIAVGCTLICRVPAPCDEEFLSSQVGM